MLRSSRKQEAFALEPELTPPASSLKADGPEDLFATQCRAYLLPRFERQHRFAKARLGRRWAFDFAFPDYQVAVEIEGLVVRRIAGQTFVTGGHATPKGMRDDMEKYNCAALLGWFVLRFDQGAVKPKRAITMTVRVLTARGWRTPT